MSGIPRILSAVIPLLSPHWGVAATVHVEIVRTDEARPVAPGTSVPYELRAQVVSAAAGDHDGLAFLAVSLVTDLGVEQTQVELAPEYLSAFPLATSAGTPHQDDLLQIGGGQDTFNGVIQPGIGVEKPVRIATGRTATPSSEGVYTVAIDTSGSATSANIFKPGKTRATGAAVVVGDPLIIEVSASAAADGDELLNENEAAGAGPLPCAAGAVSAAAAGMLTLLSARGSARRRFASRRA